MRSGLGSGWRSVVLVASVALVGVAGSIVTAVAVGMATQIDAFLLLMVPAFAATVLVVLVARPLMMRASLRQRFIAVALVAIAAAMGNLAVLTLSMSVDDHDAKVLTVLLLYSVGVGVATALLLAGSSARSIRSLARTADALGHGDLDARTGPLDGGAEITALAQTLDSMAERLQAAQARERETESMRRDLITTVSHDLRSPLSSLQAMVEAIDDGVVNDPETIRRYTGEMRRSVGQLSGMVDDLFELTQLDAGAIEAESARARLGDVVRSAVATVEHQVETKSIVLVTTLDGVDDVECSPRMVRVLQNLLVNAVRHTPADGTVSLAAHRIGDQLELSVQDSGDGIAEVDLARVFEPFFRVDPARSGPGAGLGLALAKRIVEALGGRISAESPPETGARFAVELPL